MGWRLLDLLSTVEAEIPSVSLGCNIHPSFSFLRICSSGPCSPGYDFCSSYLAAKMTMKPTMRMAEETDGEKLVSCLRRRCLTQGHEDLRSFLQRVFQLWILYEVVMYGCESWTIKKAEH
ncbi:uncharacterized protein ACBT57_007075 isoform 2-T3 [Dama dama]